MGGDIPVYMYFDAFSNADDELCNRFGYRFIVFLYSLKLE